MPAAHSPVFFGMFYGSLALEKNVVEIHDVSRTFESSYTHKVNISDLSSFLEFLYSGEVAMDEQNMYEMMHMADFYDVPSLRSQCEKFLMQQLTDEKTTVSTALRGGLDYNMPKLLKECCNIISKRSYQHLQETTNLKTYRLDAMKYISEHCKDLSQETKFEAIVNWGLIQCAESCKHFYLMYFDSFSKGFGNCNFRIVTSN